MPARVVTGQYCSVHQLLFVSSLAGMALRQPCAYRAYLWRRDAGGGSPLSPVSGADTERPAQAISALYAPSSRGS